MSTLVMDSSQDLPQSPEPCGSCRLYPSTPAWTSSVLSPGAQEELYDGRDIHVETRLRGLYGLAEGEAGEAGEEPRAEESSFFSTFLRFLVVASVTGYVTRGVLWKRWDLMMPAREWLQPDLVIPVAVGTAVGVKVVSR